MGSTSKPEVTKQEIQEATNLWVNFTKYTKWGVIAIIVVLVLMAATLL